MTWTLRLLLALMLVSVAGHAAGGKGGQPGVEVSGLPGLHTGARVTRDAAGIAHIRARSKHDLFFMQGYVTAQDRLFQMDVTRRQGSGTVAELLGADALPTDIELRTLGLRRAAEKSLPVLSPRTRAALDAYAKGVNAWVERHSLPPEYAALELTKFQPWTALDSVIVSKLVAFGLSFDLADIDRTIALRSYQEAGDLLGFDGTALFFEDLQRSAPFNPAASVPDASVRSGRSGRSGAKRRHRGGHRQYRHRQRLAGAADLGRRYMRRARKVPFLVDLLKTDRDRGSNAWVVSGKLTRNGRPLLANDPHLALGVPSTFYPVHLKAPGINVIGSSFPGTPLVAVGHNDFISWGATVNYMDVTDVYQEQVVPLSIVPTCVSPSGLCTVFGGELEPIIPIPEVFRINQVGNAIPDDVVPLPPGGSIPAATLIVPRRNGGPIIELDLSAGAGLSVQYTGWGPTRELDAIFAWNVARDLDDFIAGLQHVDFGSNNLAYADVRGNIAHFTSAEMPLREDLQAGMVHGVPPFFIRDGQGGNEWLPARNSQPGQILPFDILPFAEMPKIINPPAGFVVNANNDPIGNTLDNNPLNQLRPGGGIFYLNYDYAPGLRAGRIKQRLEARLKSRHRKISFAQMQSIQADVVLMDAQYFVPFVTNALANGSRSGGDPALALIGTDPRIVEAVGRLARWDFSTPTGVPEGYDASDEDGALGIPTDEEVDASVAATIYAVWRGQFVRNVIDSKLDPLGLPRPDADRSMTALKNLLDNFETTEGRGASGIDFFELPGMLGALDPAARRDILILQSLADALDALAGPQFAAAFGESSAQDDYRWGWLHRIVFESVLGGPFDIPPAGGAFPPPLPDLEGIPTDGGYGTVDAARHPVRAAGSEQFQFRTGPVNRFVAELRRPYSVEAESIWPGGTSGVLGSPFYANMLPLWLTNDTIPLLVEPRHVRHDSVSDILFVPSGGQTR